MLLLATFTTILLASSCARIGVFALRRCSKCGRDASRKQDGGPSGRSV